VKSPPVEVSEPSHQTGHLDHPVGWRTGPGSPHERPGTAPGERLGPGEAESKARDQDVPGLPGWRLLNTGRRDGLRRPIAVGGPRKAELGSISALFGGSMDQRASVHPSSGSKVLPGAEQSASVRT
jgi:hypothetical protein